MGYSSSVLAVQSNLLAEKMIENHIISGLLCVVANVEHPESQKNATSTLIVNILIQLLLFLKKNKNYLNKLHTIIVICYNNIVNFFNNL